MAKFRCNKCNQEYEDYYPPDDACLKCKRGFVRKQMHLEKDKEFVLHALRHTCASRLLFKGVDLVTIKEWLGHADIQTTMRYAHIKSLPRNQTKLMG